MKTHTMTRSVIAAAALLWASLAFGQVAGTSTGNGYPAGASPVTNVFSGSTGAAPGTATIPALPGRIGYICGFQVNGLGSTAGGGVTVTVGPLIGTATQGPTGQVPNSFSYQYVYAASPTGLNTPLSDSYPPCLPASAPNTAITVTVPLSAGNTNTNIDVRGYQLPAN
jgi:hypothetical protein